MYFKNIDNKKGIALMTVLFLLVALTTLGLIVINTMNTNIKISGNVKNSKKAFFCAEAGIRHAIDVLKDVIDDPNDDFDDELKAGVLSFGPSVSFGDGSYNVTVTDNEDDNPNPNDPNDDTDRTIFVTSTCTVAGSTKTIRVMLKVTPGTFDIDAALGIYGPCTPITIKGDPLIDGHDYDPPAGFACSGAGCTGSVDPNKPGTNGLYTECTDPNYVTMNGSPTVDGDPNGYQFGGGSDPNFAQLAEEMIPLADNILESADSPFGGTTTLGTRAAPEITHIDVSGGSIKFTGSVDGAGILIIKGSNTVNIEVTGTFHFEGIILVIPEDPTDVIDIEIKGSANIFGSFITEASAATNIDVKGSADITYSSSAIDTANNSFLTPKIVSWEEVYE